MQKNIFYNLILLALFFSSGCAQNGYSKFYADFSHKYSSLDPATFQQLEVGQQPKLMLGRNLQQDSFSMQVNGYVPVGYSSFQGRLESVAKALSQAQKVGATHVLLYSSGIRPEAAALYQPSEVMVANRARQESAVKPTAGFSSSRGYLQAASYWVERNDWELGAYLEDLSPDLKQQLGLEKGCQLSIVVAGTPADRAGLVSGDIVLQFAGSRFNGAEDFQTLLRENSAGRISLQVYRDGGYLEKIVALDAEEAQLAAQAN